MAKREALRELQGRLAERLQQARTDAKTDVLIAVFSAGAHNLTQTRIDVSNGGAST